MYNRQNYRPDNVYNPPLILDFWGNIMQQSQQQPFSFQLPQQQPPAQQPQPQQPPQFNFQLPQQQPAQQQPYYGPQPMDIDEEITAQMQGLTVIESITSLNKLMNHFFSQVPNAIVNLKTIESGKNYRVKRTTFNAKYAEPFTQMVGDYNRSSGKYVVGIKKETPASGSYYDAQYLMHISLRSNKKI